MSAFGGLLMSRPSAKTDGAAADKASGSQGGADAASGGADAGAGGGAASAAPAECPPQPPAQPSLPTRSPRRTRWGQDSQCASLSSSVASSSPPRTPATLSPGPTLSPESAGPSLSKFKSNSHAPRGAPLPLAPSARGDDAWWGLPPDDKSEIQASAQAARAREMLLADAARHGGGGKLPPGVLPKKRGPAASGGAAGSGDGDGSADLADYCCFRDGRYRRPAQCGAIREDRPQTKFDFDVMVIELHSVLRKHSIEPGDALVSDILQWQVRAVDRSQRDRSEDRAR